MDTKASLVIYYSELLPAHWALFASVVETSSNGRLFQVEGDSFNGFTYEFLSNPDARDSTTAKSIIELGTITASDGDIEADVADEVDVLARSVALSSHGLKKPDSSLGENTGISNSQNWVRDLVQILVDKGMLKEESLDILDTAPKTTDSISIKEDVTS